VSERTFVGGARTRREFLAQLALSAIGAACSPKSAGANLNAGPARLTSRIAAPTQVLEPGQHELPIAATRNGFLYVPRSYHASKPAPLALLLHGAGGSARNRWFGPIDARAEALGMIVVAPESRGATWDAIRGDFGLDVGFVDSALRFTFAHCAIDPSRVGIAGFSDGASYALSLGLANGDLFTHVLAFSPGFIREQELVGKPRIFVSHGRSDPILPIEVTSRVLVPPLRRKSYAVEYVEFEGGHEVPAAISEKGMEWFLKT
jgi:phospholipase/carboxylesterase